MRLAAVALALLVLAPRTGAGAGSFDHAAWDTLLQRYVDDAGRVAYQDFAERDAAALDAYLAALDAAAPDGWPRDDQVAFWINAYNATVVRGVLDGYDAETEMARYRLFSERTQSIAGHARTADDIEHTLHGFHDARVHFALASATMGGPKLRRHAWSGETLKDDLDEAARQFLLDPARNHIHLGADTIALSGIFRDHAGDFGGEAGILDWVTKHVDEATRGYLEDVKPGIEYLLFDWSLNAQPNQQPR